ncbi:MAG: heme-binding protein [Gammaproteobacteria bacterium]|nr:heme-binding protein [Gammaproteobacteria bacterium]
MISYIVSGWRAWIAALLLIILSGGYAMAIEQPNYEVIATDGDIEYRQYAGYVVAQTRLPGEWSANAAGNEAFRRLVSYISGNNQGQRKIAMTAPVAQSRGDKIAMTTPVSQSNAAGDWVVSFVMPSEYTLDTVPLPRDERIELTAVAPRLVAAIRYSGSWRESRYKKFEAVLLSQLSASGAVTTGDTEFARYNAPFVPWFLRRNEVLVEVEALPASLQTAERVAMVEAAQP